MTDAKIKLSKAQKEIIEYLRNPTGGLILLYDWGKGYYRSSYYHLRASTVNVLVKADLILIIQGRDKYLQLTELGKSITL